MYTVFINHKKLLVASSSERAYFSRFKNIYEYEGKSTINQLIDELENNPLIKNAVLHSNDFDEMWNAFVSLFFVIEAAGGMVYNNKKELLVIFRRGHWDLPKGKVEKNEEIDKAARREVEEECGISGVKIIRQVYTTYHTYMLEGERVLKETFWFTMDYSGNETLIPQTEEGITKAEWMNNEQLHEAMQNSYPSIKLLVDEVHR